MLLADTTHVQQQRSSMSDAAAAGGAVPPPAALVGPSSQQAEAERAARIAARCKRIQEKLAAARQQGDSAGGSAQDVTAAQEMTRTQQQLLASARRLVKLKHDTQQAVTAARVASGELESTRRQNDERVRQELRGRLLAEAEAAAAANAAIADQWARVPGMSVPQDMLAAIEQQRLACEAIIASKDRLIADIRVTLREKDERYVQLLRRQAADIDAMLAAMAEQAEQLAAAYAEELEAVERVALQERAELMSAGCREFNALLEARSTAEAGFTDRYLAVVRAYAASLEGLRHADAEDYQVLKIKLETDIAVLEQHLETMRGTYQLNSEKLEYNYRVLLERDAENTATINQQKRKLSRQRDVLLTLKGKYVRSDTRACEENAKLTEEYRRVTEHFKDMQAKSSHFARVDAARYSELWRLQQAEACGLVRQLLAADRVIHEQQLGWQWQPPEEGLFVSPHDGSGGQRQQQRQQQGSSSLTMPAAGGVWPASCDGGAGLPDGDAARSSGGGDAPLLLPGSSSTNGSSSGSRTEVAQCLRDPAAYRALRLLVDEAGFLVEPKVAALLRQLQPSDTTVQQQRQLVAAESVVRALGVSDGPGFDALLDALSADGGASRRAAAAATGGGGSAVPASSDALPSPDQQLVHPDDVLPRLKAFVEAEAGVGSSSGTSGGGSNSAASTAAAAAGWGDGQQQQQAQDHGASATAVVLTASGGGRRAADREREYWQRLLGAVDGRTLRVWGQLEQQLGSYHKLLASRSEGLRDVARLRAENAALRGTFNQALGSKITGELQVPPLTVL